MLWFYTNYFYKAALNTPIKRGFLQAKTRGTLKCRVLLDLQSQKLEDGFEEHGQDLPVLPTLLSQEMSGGSSLKLVQFLQ